ncbi:MarR family winged helix-turn-helix transcriptional regulator [Arachnia propionica]|uniref:MarR family transcriptional regulator n=1 Tax=Arachnia propionica TaxID=1750 RepID=A0A3P1WPN1_9ACTN|nr:MarR family transcriptional regulator [Arachnia propionica]RRD48215.1 MarR family transcriptional regulator [Arachnia propionica]
MNLEAMLLDYVDRFRSLLPSAAWRGLAEDLSQNEALTLLHLHRTRESRMSDLATWLDTPLNTATGVVARLQQRGLVERQHSPDDKRLVLISLTDEGRRLILQGIKDSVSLIGRLFDELTPEEIEVVLRVINRIPGLLEEQASPPPTRSVRRIPIE